jgi:signal transduction histidine kinase
MAQAFANLLNNAVKYTNRGGRITVRVAVEGPSTSPGAGPQVIVSISDTGVGIAPDALPRVFDMFLLNEASQDGKRDGLGIGLTLAKRLIELHDGTIEAASDGPGLGSTFLVRLPASAEVAGAPARR